MTIHDLVERYQADREYYRSTKYNETQLRADFLDVLFELLGWDIKNTAGASISEREVILEEPLKNNVYEHSKKPDYTFRLFSERKYFLEAKKPSVFIESNNETAKQVRRYGYTAKLRISVISNFEYLLIYDTSVKVEKDDNFQKALVKRYHYSEYEQYFNDIKELLGKEAIYSGLFDKHWSDIDLKIKLFSVDEFFLQQINGWRVALASEIHRHDTTIQEAQINDIVQSYLNRIIFLRVCEDRNIEDYQTLFKLADEGNYHALIAKFKEADKRYNSGLFNQLLKDKIVENISSVFWVIIKQLYYPESPYSFVVFSSDILGSIYEIFLSEKLVIKGKNIMLEKKPENIEKDIVTTPTYIINNILKETVAIKCADRTGEEMLNIKCADICCGSGAFLLRLFQYLSEILIEYYIEHDRSHLIQTSVNTFRLSYETKKKLLLNCIYGIDKDFNAVEATKFGLLLKLLEDENVNSLIGLSPILPSLDNNILYGNSLISPDMVSDKKMTIEINPFDFTGCRFDVIVGNPPYMKSEDMKNITPFEFPLYKTNFKSAYKQFDKYYLFIEHGLKLLKEDGVLGYIVPSKFIKVGAAKELRKLITSGDHLKSFVSFGPHQVFSDKTNYTCLLTLAKERQSIFSYTEINEMDKYRLGIPVSAIPTEKTCNSINSDVWVLLPLSLSLVYDEIIKQGIRLEELVGADNIFNGIQTSANDIYIFTPERESKDCYCFSKNGKSYQIEKEFTKPYFKTSQGEDNLYTYRIFKPNARVIYPYRKTADSIDLIPLTAIKKQYPFAYSYLMEYKSILNNPKRDIKPAPQSNNQWYRYGRHQSLENCILPQKIIVGVLSAGDKYAIDTYGTLISSGGTAGYCSIAIPPDFKYSIYYIQAMLNSKYLEWFSSIYGEVFRGGYIARGTKVLKNLPIYHIDFNNSAEKFLHDSIAKAQEELINLHTQIEENRSNTRLTQPLKKQFERDRAKLDNYLKTLYKLGEKDNSIPLVKDLYAAD
jgi:hypothetical protein